jgi:anti-sigma B factor antagonist
MEGLEITRLDGERGVRLAGELDMLSAPQLIEAFASIPNGVDGQSKVDLTELTFVDSSGLHALIEIARNQNGHGPLILEGASTIVLRLFEITDLARHPNLELR